MEHLKDNFRWYVLVGLLLTVGIIWYAIIEENRNGILTVTFLNVGQGDAIFIEAPNGNQMLIDGGVNKQVLRELASVMPFYDRSIDVVVATHPDQDHIGGLPDVLERFNIDYIFESGASSNSSAYHSLVRYIEQENAEHIIARRGMKIVLSDGVYLKVLFPDRDVSGIEANDASIIAQLVYGDTEFIFSGDASQKMEKYVAGLDGKGLESDVLKLGHHGSKTSTSNIFLGLVNPDYTVVSAGEDNRYGHPHKEVLDTLEQFAVPLLGTYESGTVVFETDGENLRLK